MKQTQLVVLDNISL